METKRYVYVLGPDGKPLMPTTRYGWVRRALKSGKAVAVSRKPFTIRLTEKPKTEVTQPIVTGFDPGRTNIGLTCVRSDGKELFRGKCKTRNEEIPELMANRKKFRQARRRGERLAKKRLAKKHGTLTENTKGRILPGCEKPLMYKDIINTEAKFNNRRRKPDWLTPTATQLYRTHRNLLAKAQKVLPVTDVSLELNKFDFVRLSHPKSHKSLYGKGMRKGYGSDREAITEMQEGKCLLCGEEGIEHIHHIIPVSKGGSESLLNKAGLHLKCHDKIHKDDEADAALKEKKPGLSTEFAALSVINQIIPHLAKFLEEKFPGHSYFTTGKSTAEYREAYGIPKDHDMDAYCTAMAALGYPEPDKEMSYCHDIRQFRRHDRSNIKSQVCRSYYLNGEKVAQNRKQPIKAEDGDGKKGKKKPEYPSLDQWYEKQVKLYGEKAAQKMRSQLTVKKSYRRYNNKGRYLPGTKFIYKGKEYLMTGQLTNGKYFRAEGCGNRNFPAKECKVANNTGLVFV